MYDLTKFQIDALAAIAQLDKPSGQAVKRTLERECPNYDWEDQPINHGRLYPNLDGLIDHGLIVKGEHDARTNYYEITNDGEDVLQTQYEWLGSGL